MALSIVTWASHVIRRGEETNTEFDLDELQSGKTAQERLEDLEIAAAHQSRIIEELNAIVTAHSKTITEMQGRLDALNRRAAVTEMHIRDIAPIDKPPHW
ncbi:MAG: SlyX family protein [Pseudomonadota bacterium]